MMENTLRADAKVDILKVSGTSRSSTVAKTITGAIRDYRFAEVHAIDAVAVNQAIKAIAKARGFLAGDGLNIMCVPQFIEYAIDGQARTVVQFTIEAHPLS